mmetsp:Transcript_131499/g.195923  ORF Transcript_131499/g.195923 Transcript_131499/m.195923 type:complete len:263 (-) Transcript_131499:311-1099(-)
MNPRGNRLALGLARPAELLVRQAVCSGKLQDLPLPLLVALEQRVGVAALSLQSSDLFVETSAFALGSLLGKPVQLQGPRDLFLSLALRCISVVLSQLGLLTLLDLDIHLDLGLFDHRLDLRQAVLELRNFASDLLWDCTPQCSLVVLLEELREDVVKFLETLFQHFVEVILVFFARQHLLPIHVDQFVMALDLLLVVQGHKWSPLTQEAHPEVHCAEAGGKPFWQLGVQRIHALHDRLERRVEVKRHLPPPTLMCQPHVREL